MSTDADVSVVIPAHDAAATIGEQLDAVLAQALEEPFEVLVVDNASNDATARIVAGYAGRDTRVRLVPALDGRGPSYARNQGVAAAAGSRIVCCDSDDVVTPGWLAAMAGALREHEFVGGRLEFDRLNDPVVVAGRGGDARSGTGTMGPVRFAHGCNLGIRRALYVEAGGLDEALVAGEEVDLAIRLAARGITVTEVPDAIVQYRYRSTALERWNQSFEGGRVKPFLCRALRQHGLPPVSRVDGVRVLAWLVRTLPRLRDPALRQRWLWVLASRAGQIAGWFRYRTVYL